MDASGLVPVRRSFGFCWRFMPVVLGLGLVSAVGRALQMGAAGEVSGATNILLEIVVEGARVALVLYALGEGACAGGWRRLRTLVGTHSPVRAVSEELLRPRWRGLALSFVVFAIIAAVANGAIYLLVNRSPAMDVLRESGWIAADAEPSVLVLFLKNLSVIPWTLVFMVQLGEWLIAPPGEPQKSQSGETDES